MNIYQEIREYLETIYPEVRHYSDSLFRQIYKCKVPGKRKMDVIEAGARAIVYNGKKIGYNLDDLKKFFSGTVTESLSLDEAKEYLNSKGYILEDTETHDDEYRELHRQFDDAVRETKPNADSIKRKTTKLYHQHLDLEDKVHQAYDFNIKSLFYGVEKELEKYYKKVDLEASDYDDKNKSQLVRYYFKYHNTLYTKKKDWFQHEFFKIFSKRRSTCSGFVKIQG